MTSQTRTGYVDIGELHMYHEEHGSGSPVVLLHGGMMTIDLSFGALLPILADGHLVIGVEMQGHGRTNDLDREITPAALAGDVVGLLDHLGIGRAHVLGHSLGGAVTLELAVNHPARVISAIPLSASVRPDGMHEDLTDPAKMAVSTRLPTAQDMADMQAAYQRLSPHPEHFADFLTAMSQSAADLQGWTDEQLAGVTAPTLIVQGDRDFVTVDHAAVMQRLIPGAALAVLPDTTHMDVPRRVDLLGPMLAAFLR